MADILVRRLDDQVKELLKRRAKRHGRSLEAETRSILEAAVSADSTHDASSDKVGLGTLMHRRFGTSGLTKDEAHEFNQAIDDMRSQSKPRDPGFRS